MHVQTLIILATTTGDSTLEEEIKEIYTPDLLKFRGVPKALLPVSGKPGLTWWYESARDLFDYVYIVTNAHNYKHYERWASGHEFPRENIINTGFSHGAISDLFLVLRIKTISGSVLLTPAELIYDREALGPAFESALDHRGNRILLHEADLDHTVTLSVHAESNELIDGDHDAAMNLTASPVAVVFDHKSIEAVEKYHNLANSGPRKCVTTTTIYDELVNFLTARASSRHPVLTSFLPNAPTLSYLTPTTTFSSYTSIYSTCLDHVLNPRSLLTNPSHQSFPIVSRSYARVGLMGNPSDGFYGKTLSLLISNFWAQVTLIPNALVQTEYAAITILPNPVANPHFFASLASLARTCETDGYDNGDRLIQATCRVFHVHCEKENIDIPKDQGFAVLFETNIPRQVGLAGSSAIITALWRGLMTFYGVSTKTIPPQVQASLVLSVEKDELGIAAGLQDRVIQAYGGCVFMDFEKKFVEENGFGRYERIDVKLLPKLWMAYVSNPKDSGKMHNSVRQRWQSGEPAVVEAMQTFAQYTDNALTALRTGAMHDFAQLMSANFRLRRDIYGDAALGKANLRIVEIAARHQCVAKFPGSGGAVIGMWDGEGEEEVQLKELRNDLEKEGFVFIILEAMREQ
ncbi:hypothetical protein BC936DRAFT_148260 [Jimgerdemannia flammicorona]|uniref:GHMP kinase N-terminal domain-containing protein n=1 Tax=Jimgerdemannia flammicorona TaxID=994334 RepID=A0A433D3F6_9FUNG|nr:hypothetical protein BC936DRAFT_148260 [Jimgerdemannia flammicorona]